VSQQPNSPRTGADQGAPTSSAVPPPPVAGAAAPPSKPGVRFLDLLAGLPAVLAAVGLIGGLIWEARRGTLVEAYEKQATESIKQNDLQSALVLLKRLVTLSDKPDYRFGLVIVYERSGDLARAEFLARTLAPLDDRKPDEVAFEPARFWLARRLVMYSGRLR